MIRHVVTFRFAADEAEQRANDGQELRARLLSLQDVVPGVLAMTFAFDLGEVPGHADAVLVSDHSTLAELNAYQRHPAHREVLLFSTEVSSERTVVDFHVSN